MVNFYLKIKKKVIYNFRQNDIKNNGGQGAPLTPIFHHNFIKKNLMKIKLNFQYFC